MRAESVVEEIPLYGVYMDLELNVGGRFDGTFNLDQTGKSNQNLLDATIPGRTYVIVERNDFPIWAGFIWSRTYQSQAKSVQLFGQSFENYPQYQLLRSDYVQTSVEQRNIFRDLWTTMQAVNGRNVNINVPSTFTTVVPKTVEALATDFKYYSEVMSTIADSTDGFDWYIALNKQGVFYNKNLLIGYPSLGAITPVIVFEYPGSITNYYHTESMAQAGTNIFVIGAGEGETMLTKEIEQTTMINDGFPRWDRDVAKKDVDNQDLLDTVASQEAIKRKPPMPITKISVKADRDPVFGSWSLGDNVSIYIEDSRFPRGLSQTARIVKWELHPQSSENVEEANVVFQGDEE